MSTFAEALSVNGDTGHTYRFRRVDGTRLDAETYDQTMSSIERRLGRSAAMSVLEFGREGPRGVMKFKPELSPDETATLRGMRIAIETGLDIAAS